MTMNVSKYNQTVQKYAYKVLRILETLEYDSKTVLEMWQFQSDNFSDFIENLQALHYLWH